MLGISAESWGAVGTIAGTLGAAASVVYGRIAAADKRAHDLELEQSAKFIDRLDASQKAAWVIIDDLRFNAVRKIDQDKLREEFRTDIRVLGDRLEAAINAIRTDFHRGTSQP